MAGAMKPFNASERLNTLKQRAITKYGLTEEQVHMGHYLLEGLSGDPEYISQIDAATHEKSTNLEIATFSTRLADAMQKSGLKTGDHVVIMGPNNVWIAMPFYACLYNGYSICAIDSATIQSDFEKIFRNVRPKIVFCSKISENQVNKVLELNNLKSRVVTFQGSNNLKAYIEEYKGNEKGYKPALFDHKETNAMLILTSGTTGSPKAAVVPYDTLFNSISEWMKELPFVIERAFALSSIQWLSSLMYFSSSPIIGWTRIQTSGLVNPAHVRETVNMYKPQFIAFAPHLLHKFLLTEVDACDMSGLLFIIVAGSVVSDELYLRLKAKSKAIILIVYAMTESISSPFRYIPNKTPMGSIGTTSPSYLYKLIDDDGNEIREPNVVGELLLKGPNMFKEYLNNPEETAEALTPDGWLVTGDLMSRDENNFYYYHERKKLLLKFSGLYIAPLEVEKVIKKHPKVHEAVVVGIPDNNTLESPVAAIMPLEGAMVDPKEIFALVNKELDDFKRLRGGLFFVDEYPLTVGGKIKRDEVRKQAMEVKRIFEQKNTDHCCIIL